MNVPAFLRLSFASLLIINFTSAICQDFNAYEKPASLKLFSAALKDTQTVSLVLPKEKKMGKLNTYPVIFLFDSQNVISYQNNLQTINTLTLLGEMPPCIVVGLALSNSKNMRSRLTLPNYRGATGLADNYLSFLIDEVFPLLQQQYQAANFKLFIGHSRTAIFSLYAVSKRPQDINGIIASSASYFDFGQSKEKEMFLQGVDTIKKLGRNVFCYFSVGDSAGGDAGHYASVKSLDSFMRKTKLPSNFRWKSFFHNGASHSFTPTLTVAPALNDIFNKQSQALFVITKRPFKVDTSILFSYIDKEFLNISSFYGYTVLPDFRFYNSIASYYKNNSLATEQERLALALAAWERGLRTLPFAEAYYEEIAAIYRTLKNDRLYRQYLAKAYENIDQSIFVNDDQRESVRKELLQKIADLPK
jgi:predicted alpha/beta superfamily hydrolase